MQAERPGAGGLQRVALGLGSNDRPEHYLPQALDLLRRSMVVLAVSSAWESAAVGQEAPPYLNAALLGATRLALPDFKAQVCRPVEAALDRVRGPQAGGRVTIDIDIVVYAGEALTTELWELAHRALPLAEVLPGLAHPETGETLTAAARRLAAVTPIVRREAVLPGAARTR